MAESDHVLIGDLPAELDETAFKANFDAYGTLKWFKLFPPGQNGKRRALVELGSVDEAKWLVENLHGNVPLGLETEVTIQYKPAGAAKGAGPYSGGGKAGGGIAPGMGGKGGGGGGGGKGAPGMMGYGNQWGQSEAQASTIADLWKGLLRHKVLPGGTWCNDEKTVCIMGLPSDTSDHDLLKIFSPFGAIAPGGIRVNLNEDGTAKGNGMINFLHLESAQAAIQTLNNCMLPDGKFLRLKQYGGKGKGKMASAVTGPSPKAE